MREKKNLGRQLIDCLINWSNRIFN